MEDECLFFSSAVKCLYFSFTYFVFSLFLLQKVFDIFHILLFRVFLCVFDNTYVAFFIYTKKNYKKMFFYKLQNINFEMWVIWVIKSYDYFYELLKITWNHFFEKNWIFFFLIFKDEIPKVDDLDMLKSIWFGD